jgi:predicted phosphodiesterase
MKKHPRILALFCIIVLFSVLLNTFAFTCFAAEETSISYKFDKQISDIPGYGAGKITITPGTSSRKAGWYVVCFADAKGVLKDCEPIASVAITGKTVTFEMPYGMYLPEKATQIVLFEGAVKSIDTSDISKAVDSFAIPTGKRLSLSQANLTFASVSDVHLNYDAQNYGASAKWTAALNFFDKQGVEMVVVSGDLTESGGKSDYERYTAAVSASTFPIEKIYEAKGNHDSPENTLFMSTTKGADQIHPYNNSPYFHLFKKGKDGAKDNLFIFMAQELKSTSSSPSQDNFSSQQLDWLEDLLIRYSGTNTNIFIIEHALMRNFGPGDRVNGAYSEPIILDEKFSGNMRFKALLTEYKEVILMSGHTHLSLYEMLNFSDENGTAARMIHNSSTSQPRSYTASGSISYNSEGATTSKKGSEGYIVSVYDDYILYTGYNLTTGKIIPRACYLLSSYSEDRQDVVSISLKKAPDKTVYTTGEWFDGKGMEIEATFKDGTKKVVSGWGVSNVGKLSPENPVVEIFYGTLKESIKIHISFKNESKFPFKGEGTLENPYLIENAADFKALTDLFNTSKSEMGMFGKGLHFRQTADIDMSGVEGYSGTPARGENKRFFGGNYDGGGYTLTVNIKSTGETSVFPYVYGAIYNLVMRGSIESSTSAQPIRTLKEGSVLANCDISLKLTSAAGNCICYTNYSTVYNVYVHGTGDSIFKTFSSGKAIKVYSSCKTDSGSALTDSHTTAVDSLSNLANILSDLTTAGDTKGINALKKALGDRFNASLLSSITKKDGSLVFTHVEGIVPDDNGDTDSEKQPLPSYQLAPLMWGLVQRNYNGKTASILLLKVSGTSAEHIGASLFEEGLVYTLKIGDKIQKVTPFETVGRLAIGFNLADYPEFAATESYKSYDVTLKIEKPDGTLIYEGTAQKVSSGKTKYLPLADFEKEKPADKQDTPPENNITEKDNENKSSFSPIFLVPIGAALIIVVFCALFLRRRK